MIWYLIFAGIFSVYAVDIVFVFLVAMVAKLYYALRPQCSTIAARADRRARRLLAKEAKVSAKKAVELAKKNGRSDVSADLKGVDIVIDSRGDGGVKDQIEANYCGYHPRPSQAELFQEYKNLVSLYEGKFPKVLIQLPMFNEEAHADLIIQRCCKVLWPSNKLLIQVCDDSTKEDVRHKVDLAAISAQEHGYSVQVVRRDNRQGYKAGAMVDGMKRVEDQGFEFVAIFDADFEPPEDFLLETVIHMMRDARVGFVQTRWTFINANSLLTWAQKVCLDFHFVVEQQARYFLGWFFNFNGTAGVWRINAINDAGGWESDTVVEDMDLSLRVYLKGWTSVYLHDVCCANELPSTMSAYKTQQFRWLSGPMQIVRKSFYNIWSATQISFGKKMNCYWFFVRYWLFALITLVALAAPPIILWLDEWSWTWYTIYFISIANVAVIVYLYFSIFSYIFLLFSVTTGYFKLWAMLSGLLGLKKSKSWKVTLKFACNDNMSFMRNYHKPYLIELILYVYYAFMMSFCYWYKNWGLCAYCGVMSLSFIVVSFGDYFL